MKRILNSMIYGSKKTKLYLWSITILVAMAIGLIIVSGIQSRFSLFVVGLLFGVAALIVGQSMTLSDISIDGDEDIKAKNTVKKNSETKLKDKGINISEEIPDEKVLENIDDDMLKKIMIKYKVKKDHRRVIVDRSKKLKIKECPAYIWVERKTFHLLLIEREPRCINIPLSSIDNLTYEAGVSVDVATEYLQFREDSLIKQVFGEFLPDYHEKNGTKYKNLYYLCKDIVFTNNSAKSIFDLTSVYLDVHDAMTEKFKGNMFFVRAYTNGIMLKDKAMDIGNYKTGITNILENLTASDITNKEFEYTIMELLRNRLITEDFAVYYTGLRNKNNKKKK